MSEALAYGIDFGTSNSAIAIAYPDRTEVMSVDPKAVMPQTLASILYLHRNGSRAAGQDAVQQFLVTGVQKTNCGHCPLVEAEKGVVYTDCRTHKPAGFCMDARLMTGLKSDLIQADLKTHSWATDFSLPTLVSIILATLKRRADLAGGTDVRRLVLGHPVAFVGAEGPNFGTLQRNAEQALMDAASMAGFEDIVLYPEPSAAVINETLHRGTAVALDFGGGTFDVAVIEFTPEGGRVTGLGGVAIGGERFDQMLFDRKVAPFLGLEGKNGLPGWFRSGLRTLGGTARLLSHPMTAPTLRDAKHRRTRLKTEALEAILFGGQAYAFHKAIEATKVELSNEDSSRIVLERPGIRMDIPVTESELATWLSGDMQALERAIRSTLARAGTSPDRVNLVIRTGGSSQIAVFRRMLTSIFGSERVKDRHLFNSVVSGLGSEARRVWG